tara:strand:- start:9746 stop:10891 length:1146 start_codon:yes stop_codon:yes gene_type:complete
MKIAIIDTLGEHEGAFHFYSFGQCIGLINNNVKVSLYTNNETKDPKIKGLDFFTFYHNIFSSKNKFLNGIKWILGSIISILHARFSGVKIFHFHIFYTNILVLFNLFLVKGLFAKVVITVHDVNSFSNQGSMVFFQKILYSMTDIVLTHNQFSKLEIQKMIDKKDLNIHIIPHGNYIPFISIEDDKNISRKKLGLPVKNKILLFFGLIKEVKGLEILLHSLKEVVNKFPDVVLVIAGKIWKNNFSKYQEIIDKHNLSKNCILHTYFIKQEDVKHYYSAADLVILPYKRIYQSGVLMMALSYQKPVLVSDLPPLKEVIINDFNGFVFKSEDSNSLSSKLISIFSNHEQLHKVAQQGSVDVTEKYDWNHIGSLTLGAYKSIYN